MAIANALAFPQKKKKIVTLKGKEKEKKVFSLIAQLPC